MVVPLFLDKRESAVSGQGAFTIQYVIGVGKPPDQKRNTQPVLADCAAYID
jgi:hypothetical protein